MIATITVIAEKEYGNHFPAIAATKKKKLYFSYRCRSDCCDRSDHMETRLKLHIFTK